jgi:tryptophan-rich sensory protein
MDTGNLKSGDEGVADAKDGVEMTLTIITATVVTFIVLGAGAFLTSVGPWYRQLPKPTWTPPEWIFGPAWTLILGLAAWAGVLGWTYAPDSHAREIVVLLFALNIVFHMLWSPLFFNLKRPDWALIEVPFLWVSVLALIVYLSPISPLAGWLLLPYLLWVAFAAYLNLAIVRMNPPFGAKAGGVDRQTS